MANRPLDYPAETGDTLLAESRPRLRKPPLYRVIMFNDDYTPMEFVVYVLQRFFGMGGDQAEQIMLTIHTRGRAVCGIYTRDIAETKTQQVNQYAEQSQHPLLCESEPVEQDDD